MADLRVALKPSERKALRILATRERRDPRDQAALIVVRELQRAGLLTDDAAPVPSDLVPLQEPGRGH